MSAMTVRANLRIALVGGGIGGLTAAIALARNGFGTHVFEQASEFGEVGAGIGISPNAVKVFRALGLEDGLKARGFESEAIVGRDWTTAQPLFRVSLAGDADLSFGASHIQIHRADLLDLLAGVARTDCQIDLGARCVAVSSSERAATLTLSDGRCEEFDAIVGCDGIHSLVRGTLHGADTPRFTGNVCWRGLVAAERLPAGHVSPQTTLWTGRGGHIVTFYVRGGALVNIVAVREVTNSAAESWTGVAPAGELASAYPNVHRDLRTLLERAVHTFKWGLFDRGPLPAWSAGRITLLGDAAHPMLPFLGQGAAMAIEDAYVLARALARSPENVMAALRAYEAERARTARVQLAARVQGQVLHHASGAPDLEAEWLYSYDPTRSEEFAA